MNILLAALLTLGYVFGAMLIGAGIFSLCVGCIEFVNICFMLSCIFCPHIKTCQPIKAHDAKLPAGRQNRAGR